MATLLEVETKLAELASEIIYPNGIGQPSITNSLVKIAIGYPISQQLELDLNNGNSQVSVYAEGMSAKNVTKFPRNWHEVSVGNPTLITTVINNEVVITGTVSSPQAVVVILNNKPYGYAVQGVDTLNSIATALAALIPNAIATANVITITQDVFSLSANVSTQGIVAYETLRETQLFYFIVYAPDFNFRDILASALKTKIADVVRIEFDDTTQALVTYHGSEDVDRFEKSLCYTRDVIFSVEYPTMIYSQTLQIGGVDQILTLVSNL